MAGNRSRSLAGMGYVGFPARIFLEMTWYGSEDSYQKNWIHLHKCYGDLRAYLPEFYCKEHSYDVIREVDNKAQKITLTSAEFYNEELAPLLDTVAVQIERTRRMYKPTFEGEHTWTNEELEFQKAMEGIYERLAVVVAKSKVIDKQGMSEDMQEIG